MKCQQCKEDIADYSVNFCSPGCIGAYCIKILPECQQKMDRRGQIKAMVYGISRDIVRVYLRKDENSYLTLRNRLVEQTMTAIKEKIVDLVDWMSLNDLPEDGDNLIELVNLFSHLQVKIRSNYWTHEEVIEFIGEEIMPKIPDYLN
jgi:hypothetical protein